MVSKGGEEKKKKKKVSQRRALLQDEQSLSVEICFISPSHVVAREMWASAFFFSSSFFKMLSYRITDTRNV